MLNELIQGKQVDRRSERKMWIYFSIVVLEKTLESPLNCKERKPVNPKGNQP